MDSWLPATAKTRTKNDTLWIGINPAITVSVVATVWRADPGTMLSNGLKAPMALRPTSVADSCPQYRHKPSEVSRRYGAGPWPDALLSRNRGPNRWKQRNRLDRGFWRQRRSGRDRPLLRPPAANDRLLSYPVVSGGHGPLTIRHRQTAAMLPNAMAKFRNRALCLLTPGRSLALLALGRFSVTIIGEEITSKIVFICSNLLRHVGTLLESHP